MATITTARHLLLAATIFLLTFSYASAVTRAESSAILVVQQMSEAADLDGIWIGQRMEMEGQVRPLREGQMRLTFRGRTILAVGFVGPKEVTGTFEVDRKASPKRLAYTLNGTTVEGIYEVKVSSASGTGALLVIFRRAPSH